MESIFKDKEGDKLVLLSRLEKLIGKGELYEKFAELIPRLCESEQNKIFELLQDYCADAVHLHGVDILINELNKRESFAESSIREFSEKFISAVLVKNIYNMIFIEELHENNIYLYDPNYKKSMNYANCVLDSERYVGGRNISSEEYIERFLLSDEEVSTTYKSIYDMGNPYSLNEFECDKSNMIKHLLDKYLDENPDFCENYESVWKRFFRDEHGHFARLKTYLGIDLDKFDENNLHIRQEKYKILFFINSLKQKYPNTNVLMMLGNPSLENIDLSSIGQETKYGKITRQIKHSLEMELSLRNPDFIQRAKKTLMRIVKDWQNVMKCTEFAVRNHGVEKYKKLIKDASEILLYTEPYFDDNVYLETPLETLYLKILQHEQFGRIKDIRYIYDRIYKELPTHSTQYISDINKSYKNKIGLSVLKEYIDDNAKRLAKYIYKKEKISSNEIAKLKSNYTTRSIASKVLKLLDLFKKVDPSLSFKDSIDELFLISCMQAIISISENKREISDKISNYDLEDILEYSFHAHTAEELHTQGVLKNNIDPYDILILFWIRRTSDYWYANTGKTEERDKLRYLEKSCDEIMLRILSCHSLYIMKEMSRLYLSYITELLVEVRMVKSIEIFF